MATTNLRLPHITLKQQIIIKIISTFRFLTRAQIQKLLNHKDKRRINAWLKDLTLKKYLIMKNDDLILPNSKLEIINQDALPKIYYLGLNGIRHLRYIEGVDKNFLHRFYRERLRSDEFIANCLLLADIYLNLCADTTKEDVLNFVAKSDYLPTNSKYHFLTEVSPDALIIRKKGGTKTKQYLLQIIPETMLRSRSYLLHRTIKGYLSLYFSGRWEDETSSLFPILLLILPDMHSLIKTQRYVQTKLKEEDYPKIHFWLSTKKQIKNLGMTNVEWEEVD